MATAAQTAFADKLLNCKDCGAPFAFTAGEQRFFQSKGFRHDPKHCPECRQKRRNGVKRKRDR